MVASRFQAEVFGHTRAIQPLRSVDSLTASAYRADSACREIDLSKSDGYIGSNFSQARGCAGKLATLEIEWRCEEAAFRDKGKIAAREIPGIHAGALKQRFPALVLQRQQSDA